MGPQPEVVTEESGSEDTGEDTVSEGDSLFAELDAELNPPEDESEVSTDESEGSDPDNSDTFTVTVDGEEIEVTRDELLAGYSRHSDYTKKTQEIAAERQRLQGLEQLAEALNTNPKIALETLAEQLGVDFTDGDTVEVDNDDLDDMDPLERQVHELRRQLEGLTTERQTDQQHQAQQAADAALDAEINEIKQVDPDLNEDDLLRFAIDENMPTLKLAHELWTARGLNKPSTETEDKALAAKRNAPHVESGSSRKGAKGGGKITSIADALRAAMNESDG